MRPPNRLDTRAATRPPLLLRAAPTVVVLLACIAFAPPLAIDGRLSHLEYALVALSLVLVLAMFSQQTLSRVPVPIPGVALLAVMAASTAVSYSRVDTVRDVLTFTVIALSALILVQISSLNALAVGVAMSGMILIVWGLVLLVVSPETVFTSTGALVGPYGNRNGLAYALLQSVPAALGMRLAWRTGAVAKGLVVVALSAGVVATTSKTALLALAALLAVAGAVVLIRRRRVFGIVIGGVALVAIAIGAANFGRILEAFGKGDTINGRTPIWEALLPLIGQRPVTGYGWSMAWPVQGPPSGDVRWRLNGITVYHAHNEVLNWLITTGVVGALLVLSIYVLVVWAGIKVFLHTELAAAAWIFLGVMVLLLRGLSDISETLPQGWFVLMILAAASAKYLPDTLSRPLPRWLVFDIRVHEPVGAHGKPEQE